MKYSFAQGFGKGLKYAIIAGLGLIVSIVATNQPELYNSSLVELLSPYLTQIFGTMTVGGALTIIINYLKVKYSN